MVKKLEDKSRFGNTHTTKSLPPILRSVDAPFIFMEQENEAHKNVRDWN